MAQGGSMTRIYLFVLVLNLVFPVLGYTFTAFGITPDDYETDLNPDSLMMIGINLIDGESHNLTYNGGWTYYTELNVTVRAQFMDDVRDPWITIVGDGIAFQKQGPVGKAFDSWISAYRISVKSIVTNKISKLITNDTLVIEFNTDYNWTRFILADGHHVFVTPFAPDGNMSKAVYDDAHVNVTIAKSFEEQNNFNFWSFLGWYGSLLIGDQSWGLPAIFSWFIRILAAISAFAIIMLTKDLIRL